jgi:hypothetical protein
MRRCCSALGVVLQHRPESGSFSFCPPGIYMNISVFIVGPPPGQRPKILINPSTLSHHNLGNPEQGSLRKALNDRLTELGHLQKTGA